MGWKHTVYISRDKTISVIQACLYRLTDQFALIQTDQTTIEEVFLPYMQNQDGKTLFSSLADGGFKGLALPAPEE